VLSDFTPLPPEIEGHQIEGAKSRGGGLAKGGGTLDVFFGRKLLEAFLKWRIFVGIGGICLT